MSKLTNRCAAQKYVIPTDREKSLLRLTTSAAKAKIPPPLRQTQGRRNDIRLCWIVIVALLSLIGTSHPTRAQTGSLPKVRLHGKPITLPGPVKNNAPTLNVKVTFSLQDNDNTVVSSERVKSVDLKHDGNTYSADPAKQEKALSVVLLFDTSGTMSRSQADYKKLRDAVLAFMNGSGGNDVTLRILQFNEDAVPVLDKINAEKDELTKKMNALNLRPNSRACLNKAIDEATRVATNLPGRRAVFVVTASQDACQSPISEDVINRARERRVQLYLAGVNGFGANPQELNRYSDETGGFARLVNLAEMQFVLDDYLKALSQQVEVTWPVYTQQGKQNAQMQVHLSDDTPLPPVPIEFDSAQNLLPPPQFEFRGEVRPNPQSLGMDFTLFITNAKQIANLQVEVMDKANDQFIAQVLRNSNELVDQLNQFSLADSTFQEGKTYYLRVTALDNQRKPIGQLRSSDFPFTRQLRKIELQIEDPTLDRRSYIITATLADSGGIDHINIAFADKQTNTTVDAADARPALGNQPTVIAFPISRLSPEGSYVVRVAAVNNKSETVAIAAEQFKTYHEPSSGSVIGAYLLRNPLALVGLTAVTLIALFGLAMLFIFLRNRQRPEPNIVDLEVKGKARISPSASGVSAPVSIARDIPESAREARREPDRAKDEAAPANRNTPTATLTLKEPPGLKWKASITRSSYTLGRSSKNDGKLPVDGASGVSAQHAEITRDKGNWYVADMGSSNGTAVNGKKLAKGQREPLSDGATIVLGRQVKLEFHIES